MGGGGGVRGGSEVGWSDADDAGLSLYPCTSTTASEPTTRALSRHREGGAVTRELITENAIWTLCSFLAFVCLAFGCCLLLARRVNIQSLAVMSAFNKGRSLLVCTGRPSGFAKQGAGGRRRVTSSTSAARVPQQNRAKCKNLMTQICDVYVMGTFLWRRRQSCAWWVHSAVAWWEKNKNSSEDWCDTSSCPC